MLLQRTPWYIASLEQRRWQLQTPTARVAAKVVNSFGTLPP
jgi:hypothetical protein